MYLRISSKYIALKPISSGSPSYVTASSSWASPRSGVCTENLTLPPENASRMRCVWSLATTLMRQRRRHGRFVDRRLLVVLARDDLLVIRIRPFDQAGEHQRAAGAEADMVVALGQLDLGVACVEPANLLQRLGRDDEIRGGSSGRRHVHLG